MIDDVRFLRLLDEVLAIDPKVAPDRLLTSVVDRVQKLPQRGGRATWNRGTVLPFRRRALVLSAVAAALVVIMLTQLLPRMPGSGPAPSSTGPAATFAITPTASASRGPQPANTTVIEDLAGQVLLPDTAYTSRLFDPWVTFRIDCRAYTVPTGTVCQSDYEFCAPDTSARMIVLPHAKSCQEKLRIIRPYAVDCGTSTHPRAETLATAMIGDPTLMVRDLGVISGTALPATLFAAPYPGRVLVIDGRNPQARDASPCLMLPDPATRDPEIDLASNPGSVVILLDVGNQLVVIRADPAGPGATGDGLPVSAHLLRIVHDIRFVP